MICLNRQMLELRDIMYPWIFNNYIRKMFSYTAEFEKIVEGIMAVVKPGETNRDEIMNLACSTCNSNLETVNWIYNNVCMGVEFESIKQILNGGNKMKFSEHVFEILDSLKDTFVRKNADYGDSFTKVRDKYNTKFPVILVRLSDKFNRVENLLLKESSISNSEVNESIEDTLLDLANYCIMEVAARRYSKFYFSADINFAAGGLVPRDIIDVLKGDSNKVVVNPEEEINVHIKPKKNNK